MASEITAWRSQPVPLDKLKSALVAMARCSPMDFAYKNTRILQFNKYLLKTYVKMRISCGGNTPWIVESSQEILNGLWMFPRPSFNCHAQNLGESSGTGMACPFGYASERAIASTRVAGCCLRPKGFPKKNEDVFQNWPSTRCSTSVNLISIVDLDWKITKNGNDKGTTSKAGVHPPLYGTFERRM